MSRRLGLLGGAGFMLAGVALARASSYEVEGTLSLEVLDHAGAPSTNLDSRFFVVASDQGWSIRAEYGPDHFMEVGSDGTNVYSVLHHPACTNSRPGNVCSGAYPLNDTWQVTLPWLAFCSRDYLERQPEDLPAPWEFARRQVSAYTVTNVASFFPGERPLPRELVFRFSGHRVLRELESPDPRLSWSVAARLGRKPVLDPSLLDGATMGWYRALEHTNIGGCIIPVRFELRRYLLNFQSDPSIGENQGYGLAQIYRGIVTQVSGAAAVGWESLLPAQDLPVQVADFRFQTRERSLDYVRYELTNGHWPAIDDPQLQALFRRRSCKPRHGPACLGP